jgi:hypothetical protein
MKYQDLTIRQQQEKREEWATALESGRYRQAARGSLRTIPNHEWPEEAGFTALGVACHLEALRGGYSAYGHWELQEECSCGQHDCEHTRDENLPSKSVEFIDGEGCRVHPQHLGQGDCSKQRSTVARSFGITPEEAKKISSMEDRGASWKEVLEVIHATL